MTEPLGELTIQALKLFREYREKYPDYDGRAQAGFRRRVNNLAQNLDLDSLDAMSYLDAIGQMAGFNVDFGFGR